MPGAVLSTSYICTPMIITTSNEVEKSLNCFLPDRERRQREVKKLAPGGVASEWQSQALYYVI